MSVTGGRLEAARAPVSECAINSRKVCTFKHENRIMRSFLSRQGVPVPEDDQRVVEELKKVLGVETQADIWGAHQFKQFARQEVDPEKIRNVYFKPPGPANTTALLDNHNIDTVLNQWSVISLNPDNDVFGKYKFKNLGFHMIDFALFDTTMAKFDIAELLDLNKFNCIGVVMNTDVLTGRGKHWFCLFGDFVHSGTESDPYTLEYFNSSGNQPMTEITVWMNKVILELKQKTGKVCDMVNAAHRQIQTSRTECGMFSLMYIYSRLIGHPPEWFSSVADDEDMKALRARVFADTERFKK